jgi:hypothetical protein
MQRTRMPCIAQPLAVSDHHPSAVAALSSKGGPCRQQASATGSSQGAGHLVKDSLHLAGRWRVGRSNQQAITSAAATVLALAIHAGPTCRQMRVGRCSTMNSPMASMRSSTATLSWNLQHPRGEGRGTRGEGS